jgi:hypothetical protein
MRGFDHLAALVLGGVCAAAPGRAGQNIVTGTDFAPGGAPSHVKRFETPSLETASFFPFPGSGAGRGSRSTTSPATRSTTSWWSRAERIRSPFSTGSPASTDRPTGPRMTPGYPSSGARRLASERDFQLERPQWMPARRGEHGPATLAEGYGMAAEASQAGTSQIPAHGFPNHSR